MWKLDFTKVSDDAERLELIAPGGEEILTDVVPSQVAEFLRGDMWPKLRSALHVMYSLDGGITQIVKIRDQCFAGMLCPVETSFAIFYVCICTWSEGVKIGVDLSETSRRREEEGQLESEPKWFQRLARWIAWNL